MNEIAVNPERKSRIHDELEHLSKMLSELDGAITHLREQVQPVLSPDPVVTELNDAQADGPSGSPLTLAIRSKRLILTALIADISNITAAVEL